MTHDWRIYLIYVLVTGLLADLTSSAQARKTRQTHDWRHFLTAMLTGWFVIPLAMLWGLFKATKHLVGR